MQKEEPQKLLYDFVRIENTYTFETSNQTGFRRHHLPRFADCQIQQPPQESYFLGIFRNA